MKRPLPIPQFELAFVPDTFNLFSESTVDGDRLARERAEADHARQLAEAAQARLFSRRMKPRNNSHRR